MAACSSEDQRIQPRTGIITESVYATVTLQPDSLYAVYAAASGIVDEVYRMEGDEVRKGDKIMQITNDVPVLNAENARLALDLARKNYEGRAAVLKEIEKEIQVARLRVRQDSLSYFRQKNLREKNVGTQSDFDARKTTYDVSVNNLAALLNRYNRVQHELSTQLKQAENNYQTSLIATRDYAVTSEINGKVYQVVKNQGELVGPQEPVAMIGSSGRYVIEMLVDEVDIARIESGQRVLVTLDAYEGKVFSASLVKIYPQKNERTQTFKAEAVFDTAPRKLYPGLSGEANIIIRTNKSALIIPRSYLTKDDQVKTDKGLISVETGLESMDEVEIISGIGTSTYLYKPLQP